MNRKLLREIRTAHKEHPGSPILLFDMRQRVPGLDKEEFDQSILELVRSSSCQLIKHHYPELLTKQELDLTVPNGFGDYYCAIVIKPGEFQLSTRRGWPQISVAHVQGLIRGACRIPQWLADWVMKESDEGRNIEKALIEYYKLQQSPNTVVISSRV